MNSELYKASKRLIEENNYPKAIEVLEAICQESPSNLEYLYSLWEAYVLDTRFDSAIRILETIDLFEKNFHKHYPLLAKAFMSKWEHKIGIFYAKKFRKLDFNTTSERYKDNLFNIATSYFKIWDYKRAKNNLKNLIESWDSSPLVHVILAKCYYKLENYAKSMQYLIKANYLWNESADAWELQASLYAKNWNYDTAIIYINKALSKSPNVTEYYYHKAYYLYMFDFLNEALITCDDWLKIDNANCNLLLMKAMIHLKQGNPTLAEEQAKKWLKQNPWHSKMYLLMWEIKIKQSNYNEAIYNLEKALMLGEDTLVIEQLIYKCHKDNNNREWAISHLDKAIKIATLRGDLEETLKMQKNKKELDKSS